MGSADDELVDVVHRAAELYEADRADPAVDPREVAAEMGIPAEYVARAQAERASVNVRARRLRLALLVSVSFAFVIGGAALVARMARGAKAPIVAPQRPLAARPTRVGIDVDHCEEPRDATRSLTLAKAEPSLLRGAYARAQLDAVDVVVLSHCRKTTLTDADIEALRGFVERGGGLVVADLGWSWFHHVKRPLAELPANRLGASLGFSFGASVLGPPVAPEPATGLPAGPFTAQTGWVAGDVSFTSPDARVWLRDGERRSMAGVASYGAGSVAVFGHHGLLDDHPILLARAVEIVGSARDQRGAPASTDRPTMR